MIPTLYVFDIRELAPHAAVWARRLPPGRAARMNAYHFEADRLRCLAAWLLMERFLGRGGALDEGLLEYGDYGKPRLAGGPHFNVSHSGDCVLLAVGPTSLGVDVEEWREEDFFALAALAFHPEERADFAKAPSARHFFELWTLKESYLKQTGRGLSLEPSSFCLRRRGREARHSDDAKARFRLYDDIPGYSAALCASQGDLPEGMTRVHFEL